MQVFPKRPKRSLNVRLTSMAALSTGALLSACGGSSEPEAPPIVAEGEQREDLQVFENVFACAKATGKTTEECEAIRQEAADIAATDAPRFQAKQDCEAEYGEGNCVASDEQAASGRSHFSPFIVAWFSNKSGRGGPLFNSKAGGYQTANGSRVGYGGAPGKYFTSNRAMERAKSVPKVKPASKMAMAAGFGTSSLSKGKAGIGGGSSGSHGG